MPNLDNLTDAAAFSWADVAVWPVWKFADGLYDYASSHNPAHIGIANSERYFNAEIRKARTLAALRDGILEARRRDYITAWDNKYDIDMSIILETGTLLRFEDITGFGRYPVNDDGYDIWKNGQPMVNGTSGNVWLVENGKALRFADALDLNNDTLTLWVRSPGFNVLKAYTYTSDTFTGAGDRVANLVLIGADLRGNIIDPLPTLASQVQVFAPTLLTEGTSWAFSTDGSGRPVVTFQYDLPDPAINVTFWILRES